MKPVKKEKAVESVFAESLYFASSTFGRAVEKLATECWKNSELSPSQGNLLLHLIDNAYSFPCYISSDLRVNPSTVTRLADQLESKGLIYRWTKGHLSYLGVTNKGIQLLPALLASDKAFTDRCAELFGKTRALKLATFLNEATDKITSQLAAQQQTTQYQPARNVREQTENQEENSDLDN
jgi:DNA-binding MarR family transcriptional regulator